MKLLKNFLAALDAHGGFSTELYGSLDLPLLNQDLESRPLEPRITNLQKAVAGAQVLVFASPEYNASISGPLKNAIDWCTRPAGTNVLAGKVAVLLAASPGALAGARGLIHVRSVLAGLKVWIIPEQVQCGAAHEAFDETGKLKVEAVKKQIAGAVQSLDSAAKKLVV